MLSSSSSPLLLSQSFLRSLNLLGGFFLVGSGGGLGCLACSAMAFSHRLHLATRLARRSAKRVEPGTRSPHFRQLAVAKLPWHCISRFLSIPASSSRLSMFCV